MEFEMIYNHHSSVSVIESAILLLLKNGINRVYSKNKNEATAMSVLYIFSKERIANAIANLCNADIITVNYKSKTMSYTPVFSRLLAISNGLNFEETNREKNLIKDLTEKCKILREIEPNMNFVLPLKNIDLRMVSE